MCTHTNLLIGGIILAGCLIVLTLFVAEYTVGIPITKCDHHRKGELKWKQVIVLKTYEQKEAI